MAARGLHKNNKISVFIFINVFSYLGTKVILFIDITKTNHKNNPKKTK